MNIDAITEQIRTTPAALVRLQDQHHVVKLITRGLVLGKSSDALAEELVTLQGANVQVPQIVKLIGAIDDAMRTSSQRTLSPEDLLHAETIAINLYNKDPDLDEGEALKDICVALAVKGHDGELREVIKRTRAKHVISLESLGFDTRFAPRRRDFYVQEEKNGELIASAPANSPPYGYVMGFAKNKFFLLGYKDGIVQQGHTRNLVRIKLLYGLTPGGKVVTRLTGREALSKNVPLHEIPDALAEDIKRRFLRSQEEVSIGISLAANGVRRISGAAELETIPMAELMDDLQARIAVVGSPGGGKTIFSNMLQRQIMANPNYLRGGTVTIAKDVPHLANVGGKFKSFSQYVPKWDPENASQEFLDRVNLDRLDGHLKVTISGDAQIPDLNLLSKETIMAMVENSTCSRQVKDALKKHIEAASDVVSVLESARDGTLLGEQYLSSQDDALRRLMNSVIPANYESVKKIDIRKTMEETPHVSFFIKGLNGDAYATMILWELYALQKSREILNPVVDGKLLVIDECQKFVRDDAFRDIFQRTVLDGRNFGICMLTIFQNPKEAEKHMGYPDFVPYYAALEDGKRIIHIREKAALIPSVAPEVV